MPVSRERFPGVSWTSTTLLVDVAGTEGEVVSVMVLHQSQLQTITCVIGAAQTALLSCAAATCVCQ